MTKRAVWAVVATERGYGVARHVDSLTLHIGSQRCVAEMAAKELNANPTETYDIPTLITIARAMCGFRG
jgi:hypothetical protein